MTLEQRKIEFLEEYKALITKHELCINQLDTISHIVDLDRKSEVDCECNFMDQLIKELKSKQK